MSIPITAEYIQQLYTQLLRKAVGAAPGKWAITPAGVKITARKGTFGEAAKSGLIEINPAFIGTTAHQKLTQTILHELAHLYVGLGHSHDKHWKSAAYTFGMSFETFEAEEQQVIDNVSFKYTVIAHLINGKTQCLGQVHRKTARWANYPNGKTKDRTKDGVEVLRYEFIEN